jgi:hypothetical protein
MSNLRESIIDAADGAASSRAVEYEYLQTIAIAATLRLRAVAIRTIKPEDGHEVADTFDRCAGFLEEAALMLEEMGEDPDTVAIKLRARLAKLRRQRPSGGVHEA